MLAVAFFELHQGIDIPDAMILDKSKTLRKLAEEIRHLPKLTDETFRKKVMMDKASWRAVLDRN
jgi:hypothetical protein